jgi:3-deoxy-manno-octulosonate cytidylyltransferase (CMP-KDO synthetase)
MAWNHVFVITPASADPATDSVIGIIPARWASSRFPGKPLHPIAGKPLLQHVWERCCSCPELAGTLVATDDERIAEAARAFGAEVAMTSADHPSGTDRVAEAARQLPSRPSHVLNVQGDEPLVSAALLAELARAMRDDPTVEMISSASRITTTDAVEDPNIVKVVVDQRGDALYFSRCPIPFDRRGAGSAARYRHHGLYGFRTDVLETFVATPPSPLERLEQLEQLRALDNGIRIRIIITTDESIGVDTPEQVAMVENLLSGHPLS